MDGRIALTKDFSLKADSMQWIVVEKKIREEGKEKGKEYEEIFAYCRTPEQGLTCVIDELQRRKVRDGTITSFKMLLDSYKDATHQLEKLLKEAMGKK